MKRFSQFVMSLILSGLVLYALFWHFDLRQTMLSVRQSQPSLLIIGLTLMVVAYLLRGARWRIWERSLSYWDSLRLILIVSWATTSSLLGWARFCARTARRQRRVTIAGAPPLWRPSRRSVFLTVNTGSIRTRWHRLVPVDRRLQWVLFLVSLAFAGLTLGLVLSIRFHERIRSFIDAANRKFPAI